MALQIAPGVILTPSPTKVPTPTNYISDAEYNLLTQFMPELENKIHDRFGSQMITGMLELQGKEMPFQADLIKWNEEGRLTQLAEGVTLSTNTFTSNAHTFRVGETIVVRNSDGSVQRQGQITSVTVNTFVALCGHASGWTALGTSGLTVYADSNEFAKGTEGMQTSLNSQVVQFTQSPVIVKEMIKESGSNLALQTWIEVSTEAGTGYLWYFKNYADTEKRFKNAIENKLILGRKWEGALAASGVKGTQGLFSCLEEGNIFEGPATDLDDFESIIERCNAQGMISQNYLYNTTSQGTAIDRFLKAENVTGVSWGAFNNGEKDALNLEFKGFHYGGYDFYKSRWRFLDNPTTEGSATGETKVHAVMLPSGSKKVYDVMAGESATQPLLHVRYRASQKTNRKYQIAIRSWEAGTNTKDEHVTEFQTERALVMMGRNNGFIFKG